MHLEDCGARLGLACSCQPLLAQPRGSIEYHWQPELPPDGRLPWPLGGWLVRDRESEDELRRVTSLGSEHAPTRAIRVYAAPGSLKLICTIDITPRFGDLLHCSISHRKRDPYWSEIKAMREAFYPPNIDVMMMLPAESDYVNLHEHAFHLQQCPERWGLR